MLLTAEPLRRFYGLDNLSTEELVRTADGARPDGRMLKTLAIIQTRRPVVLQKAGHPINSTTFDWTLSRHPKINI